MGFAETVLLGGIAGSTIYIGLPFGRIEHVDDRVRVAFAMFSVGILAFIFMDVSSSAENLVSSALTSFKHHHTGFGTVLGRFALLAVGFTRRRRGHLVRGAPRAPPLVFLAGPRRGWRERGRDACRRSIPWRPAAARCRPA